MVNKSPASKEQLVSLGETRALRENAVSVPRGTQSAMEFERITLG